MKPGDLVEWNYGKYRQIGIVIKKSNFYGWMIYFPNRKNNKFDHLSESSIRKIQQSIGAK